MTAIASAAKIEMPFHDRLPRAMRARASIGLRLLSMHAAVQKGQAPDSKGTVGMERASTFLFRICRYWENLRMRPPTEARRLDGLHPMDISQICTDAKTLSGSTTSGVLITCLAIGFFAGFIWSVADPRFSSPSAGKLITVSGMIAGGAAGLVLLGLAALGCHASGL